MRRVLWIVLLCLAACGKEDAPAGGGRADASQLADSNEPPDSSDAAAATDGDPITTDANAEEDGATADGNEIGDGSAEDGTEDGSTADGDGSTEDGSTEDGSTEDGSTEDGDGSTEDGDGSAADGDGNDIGDGNAFPDAAPITGNLCTSTRDCSSGEVCGDLFVTMTTIETRCTAPNPPPALPVGGACTQDSQCASNLCLDGVVNECGIVCSDAAQDCPMGFVCPSYRYNPGQVWIPICNRSCSDDDDCSATPGNLCSPQTYQRNGSWQLNTVCQTPAGAVDLGGACSSGNDCRSGLCFTLTRVGVACAQCTAGEICQCPDGSAPPCAGGAMTNCLRSSCTAICDDPGDCAGGTPGHNLTACDSVNVGFPDGTSAPVMSCNPP